MDVTRLSHEKVYYRSAVGIVNWSLELNRTYYEEYILENLFDGNTWKCFNYDCKNVGIRIFLSPERCFS